ncbi:MAG TPA: succinate dehydrogenase, cytochrome b556 subunit [Candidatus Limnocylindria bacterium]|jgi:succinate dehydrogenase / fumarate reductase cytochrome b subunit|nr:succinate dehydrogenase, cytochrome b556 subunit [Candidatus Limnocylindria bacterium]
MTVGSWLAQAQARVVGYRVSWSQLAWFGHRLSGLGVLLYLFMHIVETSTVVLGPDVYNTTIGLFRNPVIRAAEILLMAALVYHSLNGLKIILIDFVPAATAWYRPLTYGVIIATVVAMVPMSLIMFAPFAPW